MKRLRAALLRLAGVFGAGRSDRDIAEEIETHLALQAEELERSGVTPAAARRAAILRAGSVSASEDAYRDQRGLPRLEHWLRDLRYAVRALHRSALLTGSVVGILACGIGASTAIVTLLHEVAWRPLPVRDANRVVKASLLLQGKFSRRAMGSAARFSYPEFESFRDGTRALAGVAALQEQRVTWRGPDEARSLNAALVSDGYFDVLRVQAAQGRLLTSANAREPVVVISQRLWQEALNHDPGILGRSLNLDRLAYTVVGVAEPGFSGTEFTPVDVWLPLESAARARGNAALLTEANTSWLQLVGRLVDHASIAAANAEAAALAARFDEHEPGRHSVVRITPASRLDAGLTTDSDRGKVVTMDRAVAGLVVLLLLLCASNAAGLLLARGASRRKEIAVRMAIGAGRMQILRQVFVETAVIAISSASLGLLLCTWLLRLLAYELPPLSDMFEGFTPDSVVFGIAAVLGTAASLFIAVGPGLQAVEVDVLSALKGGADAGGSALRLPAARLRHLLISTQTAVSAVLLIVAALLARGLDHAGRVSPGFAAADLSVVSLDPSRGDAPVERGNPWAGEFRDRLERAPGILAVGAASIAPFKGQDVSSFRTDDMTSPATVSFNRVDEGYFRALGVTPLAGRLFGTHDDPHSVLVNASFVTTWWPGVRDVVGRTVRLPEGSAFQTATVIGVVPTLQSVAVGVPDGPTYYAPLRNDRGALPLLVVRASPGAPLERLVRTTAASLDADAVVSTEALSARLAASEVPSRVMAGLAGVVGAIALLMAAIGIHGIVAYSVTCRTRDIGIHLALGAPRTRILGLVVRSSVRAAIIGAMAGGALVIAPAIVLSRVVAPLLFGLSPLDPFALLAGTAMLTSVTVAAAYVPARRALDVRPVDALRQDG